MVESSTDHMLIPPASCGRMSNCRINPKSRRILATIFVAFFLANPVFVTDASKDAFSISSLTTPISISHGSESIHEVIQAPRGGGIGMGTSKRAKGSLYLKALNDEILWMEQQLRRVEQETRSLKKKLSNRQQIREVGTVNTRQQKRGKKSNLEKNEEDLLRLANLEQLEKQKESLLSTKAQLESIKLDYDEKLDALQSDLLKSKSRNANIEKTFLARVKELETSLKKVREAASNTSVNNDPDLARKIQEACQVAIADFWVEGNRKLQEHERQLKARYEQELMEERRLATIAVDKQRQKMRALARATAIREKEIAARTKLLSRQQSQTKQKSSSDSSQKNSEKLEREKIKRLREEAERKAKEEEEHMWLELERELEQERERLQRMKQREEEEKQRCEQEELERRRLLRQHALDLEARLRKEQQQAANGDFNGGTGSSVFGRLFRSRKKMSIISDPTIVSIENYQRRVMWQPISLPPKETIQITGPKQGDN